MKLPLKKGVEARQRLEPRVWARTSHGPGRAQSPHRAHRRGLVKAQSLEGVHSMRRLRGASVPRCAICYIRYDRNQMPPVRLNQFSEAFEPPPDRRVSGSEDLALWLYTPNMPMSTTSSEGFPYAPATVALISAFTSPSQGIELCVTLSGKPMRRPLSWRGWRTRPWLRRLYGTISQPLTAAHGAAEFISSLPDIPVSLSASLESAEASKTLATSGQPSAASSERSPPAGCSWKTSKATSIWDFPKSAENWSAWVTTLRRDCSRREKSAPPIDDAASSCWPTPTASDKGYFPDLIIGPHLVKTTSPFDISRESGGQYPLALAARAWTILWMILQAVGWTSAATAICPSSPLVRVTFRGGKGSFADGLTSNPVFYEMVMGWPMQWTAPEGSVTGFAAWLRRSRGLFSSALIRASE